MREREIGRRSDEPTGPEASSRTQSSGSDGGKSVRQMLACLCAGQWGSVPHGGSSSGTGIG
jgi:hypothetical protein